MDHAVHKVKLLCDNGDAHLKSPADGRMALMAHKESTRLFLQDEVQFPISEKHQNLAIP